MPTVPFRPFPSLLLFVVMVTFYKPSLADSNSLNLNFHMFSRSGKAVLWNGIGNASAAMGVGSPTEVLNVTAVGPDLVEVQFRTAQILSAVDPRTNEFDVQVVPKLTFRVDPSAMLFFMNLRPDSYLAPMHADSGIMKQYVKAGKKHPLDVILRYLILESVPEVSTVAYTRIYFDFDDIRKEVIEGDTHIARVPLVHSSLRSASREPYEVLYEPWANRFQIVDRKDSLLRDYNSLMLAVANRYWELHDRGWLNAMMREPGQLSNDVAAPANVIRLPLQCKKIF